MPFRWIHRSIDTFDLTTKVEPRGTPPHEATKRRNHAHPNVKRDKEGGNK